jgi:hypothetical protein
MVCWKTIRRTMVFALVATCTCSKNARLLWDITVLRLVSSSWHISPCILWLLLCAVLCLYRGAPSSL